MLAIWGPGVIATHPPSPGSSSQSSWSASAEPPTQVIAQLASGVRGPPQRRGWASQTIKNEASRLAPLLFCVSYRRSACSPSWGTTTAPGTSASSRSTPTPWALLLRGLGRPTGSRGRPTPGTPSPHSTRAEWWRDWGPQPGLSHCRRQTQES